MNAAQRIDRAARRLIERMRDTDGGADVEDVEEVLRAAESCPSCGKGGVCPCAPAAPVDPLVEALKRELQAAVNVGTAYKRERDEARRALLWLRSFTAYWLLRARKAWEREGWEEGPSEAETQRSIVAVLGNLECDEGTEDEAQVRAARAVLALKMPHHTGPIAAALRAAHEDQPIDKVCNRCSRLPQDHYSGECPDGELVGAGEGRPVRVAFRVGVEVARVLGEMGPSRDLAARGIVERAVRRKAPIVAKGIEKEIGK